jgi:DNA anti-recombination protein RmuC
MKKLLIGALAVVLLTSPFAVLRAEDATSSQGRNGLKNKMTEQKETMRERFELMSSSSKAWKEKAEERKGKMEDVRERMQTRFEEMKNRFDEKRAEVITNILNRLEERFQKAIDRMTGAVTRIQERIDLLEAGGSSLTEAQGHLDDGKQSIADAQDALTRLDLNDIGTTTASTTVKTIRGEFKAIKEILKTAHSHLSDAINSIKKGVSDGDKENNGQSDKDADNQ